MAAIAIPLVVSALGSLGPLIAKLATPLIQLAEAHFAPKTGTSKMETVLQGLQAFLTPLASSGTIQQPVPSTSELQSITEGVLAGLKATGQMPVAGSGSAITTAAVPVSASAAGLAIASSILNALQGKV